MNDIVKSSLIFAAGLAIGSVATWLSVKNHYKALKEEEVASLREVYDQRLDEIQKEEREKVEFAKNKPDILIYTKALQEAKERAEAKIEAEEEEEEIKEEFDETTSNLYEITTSEFASFSNDRTRVTITRFADDVFADEMYDKINPMDYLSGDLVPLSDSRPINCLDYIRKMSQDEICIRNFDLGLDIDICTKDQTYSDFMAL